MSATLHGPQEPGHFSCVGRSPAVNPGLRRELPSKGRESYSEYVTNGLTIIIIVFGIDHIIAHIACHSYRQRVLCTGDPVETCIHVFVHSQGDKASELILLITDHENSASSFKSGVDVYTAFTSG